MCKEPDVKRTVAFFDGQNLFHHRREAFGYDYPSYAPRPSRHRYAKPRDSTLVRFIFIRASPAKLMIHLEELLGRKVAGNVVRRHQDFSRSLRYRKKKVKIRDGIERSTVVGEEKGIDVRIALDVIRMVRKNELDVVLLFSQDQDFSEVADEVKTMAREQNRWIKFASAFPVSRSASNLRGVNNTEWIEIDRATYDACLDARDYRPKPKR